MWYMTGELPPKYRLTIAAAREIAKAFTHDLPIRKLLQSSPQTDKGISRTYHRFRDIFDDMGTVGPLPPPMINVPSGQISLVT